MPFKFQIPFSIGVILLFACCIRLIPILTMYFFDVIPQQWTDESSFYNYATDYLAINSGTATQNQIDGISRISQSREFSISYLASFVMSLFGDSIVIYRTISMLFGLFSIFLVFILTYEISSSYSLAKLSTIVATLFPTQILYSSMFTREPFMVFFILLGLLFLILHKKNNNYIYIILFIGCIFIENYMHGGVAFALSLTGFTYLFLSFKRNTFFLISQVLILMLIFLFIDFTYLNNIQNVNVDFIIQEITKRSSGSLGYISSIDSLVSLIYTLPSMVFKFVVGFPINLSFNANLIMINSVFWLILLSVLFFLLPKTLPYSNEIRLVSIATIILIVVYSIGSANYGTALRHKSKITPLVIVLATSSIAIRNRKYLTKININYGVN